MFATGARGLLLEEVVCLVEYRRQIYSRIYVTGVVVTSGACHFGAVLGGSVGAQTRLVIMEDGV
jgi:hypothetical protein